MKKKQKLRENGCGKNLGSYMKIPKEYKDKSDKIRRQHAYPIEVICGKNDYCEICKIKIEHQKLIKETYLELITTYKEYIDSIFKDKFGFENE